MLKLAAGDPEGIIAALGHKKPGRWVGTNINAFFQEDGPLGGFMPVASVIFQWYFSAVQRLARSMYNRDHSNDQSGSSHEDIPNCADCF